MSAINATIRKAASIIGAIGKDSKNEKQNFRFRGIDAVMNRCSKVFSEVGLFVTPEVLSHDVSVRKTSSGGDTYNHIMKVRFTFYCSEDDSTVSCVVAGEASDGGDKGASKAMAIALKYALFIVLMIALEDEADPDMHSPMLEPSTKVLAAGKSVAGDTHPTATQICEAFEACSTPEEFKAASAKAAAAWASLSEPAKATLKSFRESTKERLGL